MDWNTTLYALPLAITVAITATLALYAWQRRSAPGAAVFALIMLAVSVWMLGYALELTASSQRQALFWAQVQYPGLVTAPVGWLIFALVWSGQRQWMSWRRLMPLLLIPLITVALVWTNQRHGLIWRQVELRRIGPYVALRASYGPWFVLHALFSHLLILIGMLILLRQLPRTHGLYRRQLTTLLLSVLLPWLSNILYVIGRSPVPHLDIAPFSFAVAGLGIGWGLFYFRLLDVTPVARDVLIEGMRDAVFVLDVQQRIVDLNRAASRLLEPHSDAPIGWPISTVLPGQATLLAATLRGEQPPTTLLFERAAEQLACDLTVSPLTDRRGRVVGTVLVLRDVTERLRAEAATRASEERYRIVSELTSDYTYALQVDRNGDVSVEWVTDAFTRVTGYTSAELGTLGGWLALVHPDDLPIAREFETAVLGGQTAVQSFRLCRKDGTVRWLQHYAKPIWDEQQQRVVRVLGAGRDITVRTEVIAALTESEQRYRLLFEGSPLPMWVYDQATLAFLAVNRAAIRHYGYSEIEFRVMRVTDLVPSQEQLRPRGFDQADDFSALRCHRTKDGRLIDVEITVHAIDFDNRPACVVLAQDVTERRRAEHTLRQQNEYLAALHETTLTVMNRLELSDVLETILVRAASLVGTSDGYLCQIEPNPAASEQELVVTLGVGVFRSVLGQRQRYGAGLSGKVWQTGRPLVVNGDDQLPGGSAACKNCAGVCVPLKSGTQVVGVIGLAYMEEDRAFGPNEVALLNRFAQLASIALENARLYTMAQQEINERRRAEADLAQARDQALEAVRLKSEFLAIMSHELRTPLNAIIGFTDLTLMQQIGPLNEQQRSNLQRVSRNAHHLLAQINGILDMSKLDADGMQLAHEPMRVEDVVARAISNIETLVTTKQLRLTVRQSQPSLPLMLGDAGRLQQMLINLLSNAVKFTPPDGAITVVLEYGAASQIELAAPPTQALPAGMWLALSVQDTGSGIPPEEQERVWSEFYQIDGSATRQHGGTGLGLAIVKRMAERMGGQVGLRSAVTSGSTFTIWLPVSVTEQLLGEQAVAISAAR